MSGNRWLPRPKTRSARPSAEKIPKTAKQMERHLKGIANHWRIAILLLIGAEPGISVEGISDGLKGNFKTIAEHIRRLALAGLVIKKYQGHNVIHTLSPYGERFVKFLNEFQNS